MVRCSLKAFSVWLAALACLLAAPARAGITYDMVTVGNAGNAGDTRVGANTFGFGAVAYDYQIGKYDVTIGQYTSFLNAVAATDTYSLYNSSMGTNLNIAGISRTAGSGGYTYSVIGSANRPITYVSWWDSARFANWMANGQPTGAQTSTTTENGAYNVNGATTGNAVAKNATNPNTSAAPTFYVPTANEWYKAAYYSPTLNSGSGGYYAYATQSNTAPGNVVGSAENQANFKKGVDGVFSVTQSSSYSSSQNYLTDVGAFSRSGSFYGTFDQSGNVAQWNDLDGAPGSSRGWRGGGWGGTASSQSSSSSFSGDPSSAGSGLGFRLTSPVSGPSGVPEIDPNGLSAALGLIAAGLGLLERRRYGR
jgi:formylglycine-generating enzyme required for sulfatase activity